MSSVRTGKTRSMGKVIRNAPLTPSPLFFEKGEKKSIGAL